MIDWWHWHNELYLVGGTVLAGWLYAMLAGPWREQVAPGARLDRTRAALFAGGLVVFYAAVGSPLDQAGEQFLLSAHMLQHLLLALVAAPLLVAGLQPWMADAVLRHRVPRAVARRLVHPVVAVVLYHLVIGLWHLPDLYDFALRNRAVHVAEHLSFTGAALVFWWVSLSPSRLLPPLSPGPQLLLFFLWMAAGTPLFAAITFQSDVLYPTYEFAPRLTALSAHEDQVLAGTMMKLASTAWALAFMGRAFWRWYLATGGPDLPALPARVPAGTSVPAGPA